MSGLLVPSLRAGHLFRRTSLLGSDDGPALFAELDQSDHARLYALNIVDERRFLAFLARHCLERILAGHERDVRHSLLEGLEPGLHGRGIIAQHMEPGIERSEEHTSELQSLRHLVCRLLLEKKKNT